MDKNTILGFILIAAILIGYSWWNSKNAAQEESFRKIEQQKADSIARVRAIEQAAFDTSNTNASDQTDSLKQVIAKEDNIKKMGELMTAALEGKQEFYTVENDLMRVVFTNKGARIYSVELKQYKAYGNRPLILFQGNDNDFTLRFFTRQEVSTSSFYFTPQNITAEKVMQQGDSVTIVPFRLYADSVSYVEFQYTILKNSYRVGFDINMVGMNKHMAQQSSALDFEWIMNSRQQEKGFDSENNYSTIAYKFPNEKSIEELGISKESKKESIPNKLEWINLKQHFFSTILVTQGSSNNELTYNTYIPNNTDSLLKRYEIKLRMDFNSTQNSQTIPFEFFFLPNHFRTLKSYDHSFERIIPLGGSIIGIINRAIVIPVFNFLKDYIPSFGIIILILTIILKLILTPLTWKSYISSAKMKVLKPEVDKINEKYPKKEDALKKQQEVMALYKRTGVNMLGGCLPMLLQIPILFAMFRFFPSSIELRQEPFLWADDLSAYDSILNLPFNIPFYGNHISLFCLLMAISMYIQTKISMSQQPTNSQFGGMNTMMLYIMPVFMLVFFNNLSSGLSYYYFLSNVITIGQTFIIRKFFVNEADLLRKLNERAAQYSSKNSKKPAKKGFMARLEEKAREQQRLQQQQMKNKKKK